MTPEQVIGRVFGVGRAAITDQTSNQTLEQWDSMGHVTLILEMEAAYGISLSTEDTLAMTDVAAIKRVLGERGVRW